VIMYLACSEIILWNNFLEKSNLWYWIAHCMGQHCYLSFCYFEPPPTLQN